MIFFFIKGAGIRITSSLSDYSFHTLPKLKKNGPVLEPVRHHIQGCQNKKCKIYNRAWADFMDVQAGLALYSWQCFVMVCSSTVSIKYYPITNSLFDIEVYEKYMERKKKLWEKTKLQ